MEPFDFDGVHVTHCCRRHGCKYGSSEECPVAKGHRLQEFRCERCPSDETLDRVAGVLLRVVGLGNLGRSPQTTQDLRAWADEFYDDLAAAID